MTVRKSFLQAAWRAFTSSFTWQPFCSYNRPKCSSTFMEQSRELFSSFHGPSDHVTRTCPDEPSVQLQGEPKYSDRGMGSELRSGHCTADPGSNQIQSDQVLALPHGRIQSDHASRHHPIARSSQITPHYPMLIKPDPASSLGRQI